MIAERLLVIGLGLIGGSFAQSLRKRLVAQVIVIVVVRKPLKKLLHAVWWMMVILICSRYCRECKKMM